MWRKRIRVTYHNPFEMKIERVFLNKKSDALIMTKVFRKNQWCSRPLWYIRLKMYRDMKTEARKRGYCDNCN